MFLRPCHRTKDGKRHTYYVLVESRRTARGPRQRVVAQLGDLTPDERRRWERTAIFQGRSPRPGRLSLFDDQDHVPLSDDGDVVRIRLGSVGWTHPRSFGDVWMGLYLWRTLGLDEIVFRHIEVGREEVPHATMVAIEVISRLCVSVKQGSPTSEFALAEYGYRETALEDLLGVPDAMVTKDRLYRTLDALLAAKEPIERDLKERLGELFSLNYDLLLCDLTSSFFEGLLDDNELARRGHSRDKRPDCKQIIVALVVTQDGFPLFHETFAGNTKDEVAFPEIVEAMQSRFGKARRVWVLDRGIANDENVAFLREQGQSFLVGTNRSKLKGFEEELRAGDWEQVRDHVEIKCIQREGNSYLLARSEPRREKERAIRRRQLLGLHGDLKRFAATVAAGRLKNHNKVQQRIGRLRERWPKAAGFVNVEVDQDASERAVAVRWSYQKEKLRSALLRDGAYLLLSDQTDWTAEELWKTYMQLIWAEAAFRAMKSHLLLRPMWHHLADRVRAHVFVCVLAYGLWKALDHLLKGAGVMTRIHKVDEADDQNGPQDRPMSPAVALRIMQRIQIGDILMDTTDGRKLCLRRVARPDAEQAELLAGLKLTLPERICADYDVTDPEAIKELLA